MSRLVTPWLRHVDGACPFDSFSSPTLFALFNPLVSLSTILRYMEEDADEAFYDCDPGYCGDLLNTLQAPVYCINLALSDRLLEDSSDATGPVQVDSPVVSRGLFQSVPISYSNLDDSDCLQIDCLSCTVLISSFAYPEYESCTPAIRSISSRRDQQILEFIPYADEPGFHGAAYSALYDTFAWQTSWYDVDYEQQIPFYPMVTGSAGLLSTLQKRDLLRWGTAVPTDELNIIRTVSKQGTQLPSLWKSVRSSDSVFCRSTNCVEALCTMHKHPKAPLTHVRHRKANAEYEEAMYTRQANRASPSCHANCYRSEQDVTDDDPLIVNSDVCDVLKLFPDAPMCKLASLCRVDCRDVYHHRLLLLPTESSSIPQYAGDDGIEPKEQLDPYLCNHEGPCKVTICTCARDRRRCSRRCSCAARCAMRGGCSCKHGICKTHCPCHANGWECSPDFCIRPKLKYNKARITTSHTRNQEYRGSLKHFCKFMPMQREIQPAIAVSQGSYGLGAFAQKNLAKDTYLGEYTAEMFPALHDPKDRRRFDRAERKIHRHRKRNYLYTLDSEDNDNDESRTGSTMLLDAATAGNPTRSLNDSRGATELLNVAARTVIVDGDRRIMLYTTTKVEAGQELLLGYGENYWIPDNEPSSDEERFDMALLHRDDTRELSKEIRTAYDDERDNA
ncbi:SET domain-containing protein [Lentinus tigrinus ALCF2SS1-6]|uniref:SET domain-containing protein n=1 Tax=Lentinus tigrinus ALCF2SS1-6 TaxID=1328759 RepID=A0A5C2RW64_9APHY|nr:SET domain-containing protein [Lentinus tigrinus ALCF2SS1-6]